MRAAAAALRMALRSPSGGRSPAGGNLSHCK
jgi:hypothetical protein